MNFLMTGSYSAADSLGSEKSYFEAQTAGQVSEMIVDTERERSIVLTSALGRLLRLPRQVPSLFLQIPRLRAPASTGERWEESGLSVDTFLLHVNAVMV